MFFFIYLNRTWLCIGGLLDDQDGDSLQDDGGLSDNEFNAAVDHHEAAKQSFITINVTNELGHSKTLDSQS